MVAVPVAIEDVARRAGVSVSTVSRALREVHGVSPSTRVRVRAIAEELGYVLSPIGSRLATGRTATIAVVLPNAAKWFFGQVIGGAGAVFRRAGFDVLLYELGDAEGRRRFFSRQSLAGRADAVLVLSLGLSDDELESLRQQGLPVVLLGTAHPGFGSVLVDDRQAAQLAVRHLLNLGHQRLALIGIDDRSESTMDCPPPLQRLLGFREALRDAGLESAPELEQFAENSTAGGASAMAALLSASRLPTAVFVGSDEMAFGALRTLRRAGLSVPGDISVVGFDNHELSEVLDVTTVDQSVRLQGETAGKLLLDALANPAADPGRVVIPTRLVIRTSTAPPRHQTTAQQTP